MSDDVRIATGFKHHRKTKRLRRRLGSEGVEWLIYLWAWAADAHWTGNLAGLSDEDIECEIDWPGEPGVLLPVLEELKFIDGPAGARRIHDWAEWNPYAAAKGKRIARGKKGAAKRWGKAEDDVQGALFPEQNASSMPDDASSTDSDARRYALGQCPPAPAPAPAPSPPKSESSARAVPPEAAERTARALEAAGCEDANGADPRLAEAVADGLGAALIALASTKKGHGKGLAYLIATVRGQQRDSEKISRPPAPPACDPVADARARARRDYEDALIEIRHYAEVSCTIDAAERARRESEAAARFTAATGESPPPRGPPQQIAAGCA